jgi:RNA polymerase sigma-70 factor (ECF subfamily)
VFIKITNYDIICEIRVFFTEDKTMQNELTDEALFESIYHKHKDAVYRISLYYTKDEYIAEDVMQKTFLQFHIHQSNVNPDGIRGYLLRTARNFSYNWIRDTRHETEGEYIDNIPEENLPLYSAEDEVMKEERRKEREWFAHAIMEELREENEAWYVALDLIYFMEKPFDEVAEELNITKEVLYSRFYRAKRWIRKKFEARYGDMWE